MRVLLLLDLDPHALSDLLAALTTERCTLVVYTAQQIPPTGPPVHTMDDTALRAMLTLHGLTPRECDLILLDLQGRTRTEIAAACGLSPTSIKKYWTGINAKLGVQNRQILRQWVVAQYYAQVALPGKAQEAASE